MKNPSYSLDITSNQHVFTPRRPARAHTSPSQMTYEYIDFLDTPEQLYARQDLQRPELRLSEIEQNEVRSDSNDNTGNFNLSMFAENQVYAGGILESPAVLV